jgi:hypothetical protein
MEHELFCGAACRLITPPAELLPHLHGLGGRSFVCVLDDLHLRVIALRAKEETALIVSAELDKVPWMEADVTALAQATGVGAQNILLFSTHCHTAPVTGDRPTEGPNDLRKKPPEVQEATRAYQDFLTQQLHAAAKEALAALRPANLTVAKGTCYLNINRLRDYVVETPEGLRKRIGLGLAPEGPVDHTLLALRFEDLSGQPIAFLVNYAMHNVAMIGHDADGHGGLGCSSDISGQVCQFMEQAHPGSVCAWSSGAAGDVNPMVSNEMIYPDPASGDYRPVPVPGKETAQALCALLAANEYDDLRRALRSAPPAQDVYHIKGGSTCSHTPSRQPGVTYDIPMQALRIGSLMLVGIGGELYTTLGWQLQQALPPAQVVIINHEKSLSANAGYILDDATIARCAAANWDTNVPGTKCPLIRPGFVADDLIAHLHQLYRALF